MKRIIDLQYSINFIKFGDVLQEMGRFMPPLFKPPTTFEMPMSFETPFNEVTSKLIQG